MKFKTVTPVLLVLLFLSFSTPTIGQNKSKSNAESIEALSLVLLFNNLNNDLNNRRNKPYLGEMTLKNGDFIEGYLSLNNPVGDNYVVIYYTENDSKIYPVDTIDEVKLYKTDNTNADTVFKTIENEKALLREVYNNNGDVAVYDTAISPFNNKLSGSVYVKENDALINTWFFWTSGPKHDLLRYIRNKDGVRYKRKDFESLDDLLQKV
ncbi:hypothetical protein FG167_12435 [Lacinutrix sp. WUR7]|uniref:hypothetical protein n=1 Tax=Lacinutrix sp. WUR7 TaxID=2653681 RepID=UPI00193E44D1|nr:hypothetical protein [Lacinutrix sp. WUR7]QRM90002.1 hypothetical protein FG167_12435 [Lacinutrix sp. WUR7]